MHGCAGKLRLRGPRALSRQREDRDDRDPLHCPRRHDGRFHLHRRTQARKPVPPRSDGTGFGMHAKLVGSVQPDPQTGQVNVDVRRPAAGPVRRVRRPPVRIRPRPHGDPDSLPDLRDTGTLLPMELGSPGRPFKPDLQHRLWSERKALSGAGRVRSTPRLAAGTSSSVAGAHTGFALQLDRDDGDQFLGDLNFTMPPGLTASLRGITYCPECGDRRAPPIVSVAPSRPPRVVPPHHRSERPMSLPAQARTRSTRSGRCISPAPSRVRRFRWWQSLRRSPVPTTTARRSSASRSTSTPATPTSWLFPTRFPRSSAGSRSACARSGSASTARTS